MITLPHLLAGLALIFAIASFIPVPRIQPSWLLAIAVLLLAILQFAS